MGVYKFSPTHAKLYIFSQKKQHFPNILLKIFHPNFPFLKNYAI